jgi:hypothetical protein
MKGTIFLCITPCSPFKVNMLSCWILARLIVRPWRWSRDVPPKGRFNFQRTTRRYIPEGGTLWNRRDLEGSVRGMVEVQCQHLSEWDEALVGANPSENLESPLNTACSTESHVVENWTSLCIRTDIGAGECLLSRLGVFVWLIRRGFGLVGCIDTLYTQLGTTGNTALPLIYTHYSSQSV